MVGLFMDGYRKVIHNDRPSMTTTIHDSNRDDPDVSTPAERTPVLTTIVLIRRLMSRDLGASALAAFEY